GRRLLAWKLRGCPGGWKCLVKRLSNRASAAAWRFLGRYAGRPSLSVPYHQPPLRPSQQRWLSGSPDPAVGRFDLASLYLYGVAVAVIGASHCSACYGRYGGAGLWIPPNVDEFFCRETVVDTVFIQETPDAPDPTTPKRTPPAPETHAPESSVISAIQKNQCLPPVPG
ncbi:MAG: hypothetical protein RL748_538, partial [Pseudomonadota bacterium]